MVTKEFLKKQLTSSKSLVHEMSLKERYEWFKIIRRAAHDEPRSYCKWLELIEKMSADVITWCKL